MNEGLENSRLSPRSSIPGPLRGPTHSLPTMAPTFTQNDLILPTGIVGSDPDKLEGWVKVDIGVVLGASYLSILCNHELTPS